MSETLLIGLTAFVMLLGLLLTLASLPGMTVIWIAALIYGLMAGFGAVGPWVLGIAGVMMLASYAASFWLRQAGAKHTGASWKGIALGCVFGLFGAFLLPVLGLPLGVVAGVYVVEYARLRDYHAAWQTTRGAVLGIGAGIIQEFAVGLAMIGLWLYWVLAG
ncbi:MAG: DUF456 family protein [Anaerolineales bacterium]